MDHEPAEVIGPRDGSGAASRAASLEPSRRTFLAMCAAVGTAAAMPVSLRLGALRAFAASSFSFSAHERAVLRAAANTVVPPATVFTSRYPTGKAYEGAGDSGAVAFVENLLTGAMIFAAGASRPPYVTMPAGVTATYFPRQAAYPLWTVKAIGWFGDAQARPTRDHPWPSELERLQKLYRDGVSGLDSSAGGDFTTLPALAQEGILRQLQAQEVAAYNGQGEGNQPFFLTFLDHVAQACFGDPIYGGNKDYQYWEMCNFSGPSYLNGGGPAPGQGWSWKDLQGQFDRSKPPGIA